MAVSGVYMVDVNLLERLDGSMKYTGEAMMDIDQQVINHINSVMDKLQEQMDYIQQRLSEAEARLRDAENALNVCHASQVYVPEVGIVPSCMMEECAVDSARMDVEKWQTRYNRGQQIVADCRQEISDYASGGHELIRNMSENQYRSASQRIGVYIEHLQGMLNQDMVGVNEFSNSNATELSDHGHEATPNHGLKSKFNL